MTVTDLDTVYKLIRKHASSALAVLVPGLLLLSLGLAQDHAVMSAGEPTDAPAGQQPRSLLSDSGDPPQNVAAGLSQTNTTNCRYGVSIDKNDQQQQQWVSQLGAGWYLDFTYYLDPGGTEAQYVPLIWVKQNKDEDGNYLPSYRTFPKIDIAAANNPGGLRYWVEQRPGSLWIIGNEVDRGPDPGHTVSGQGDTFPHVYAEAYHDIVAYIKQYDPTAKVAVSGLVQATPGRLQYLDLFWQSYLEKYHQPPTVDVWTMHIYILPERGFNGAPNNIANIALGTDLSLGKMASNLDPSYCNDPDDEYYCLAEHDDIAVFDRQIRGMRTWMKAHGQQNKPLIISEYSILYPFEDYDDPVNPTTCFVQDEFGNCFTEERVKNFMEATFAYLENTTDPTLGYPLDDYRLIQQWLWFSVNNDRAGYVSNLTNATQTALSGVGQLFKDSVEAIPLNRNLRLDTASHPKAFTVEGDGADTEIWVSFRNDGNAPISEPFSVSFYRNAALTNPIATATVTPAPLIQGCSQMAYKASVNWTDLAPGRYRYWAKLDSGGAIDESDEADNVANGVVFVDPEQSFLPLIHVQTQTP